jgi:hypothetical protein
MSDPTTTLGAAVAAGFGTVVVAAIGVEPRPLFWALVGATLGLSMAAQTSRSRAVIVFVCVVLAAALAGTWLSLQLLAGNEVGRDLLALLVAGLFHPLFGAAAGAAPRVIDGVLRKFGLGGTP